MLQIQMQNSAWSIWDNLVKIYVLKKCTVYTGSVRHVYAKWTF